MQSAQAGLFVEPGRSAHYLELQWQSRRLSAKRRFDKSLQPVPEVFIAVVCMDA